MAVGCVVLLTMMIVEKFTKKRRGAESKRAAKTPEGSEVDKMIRCVMEGREISGNYDLLHKTKGGVHMLIGAAFTLLSTPKERCTMARYIFDQELEIHVHRKDALKCLRSKGWSNKDMYVLLDHVEKAGCLKEAKYQV